MNVDLNRHASRPIHRGSSGRGGAVRAVLFAGIALFLAAATGRAPVALAAPPTLPASAALQALGAVPDLTYELVDTWEKVPWALTAGRYGQVRDISSDSEGSILVLDGRHEAVHVLQPDATPSLVWEIPEVPESLCASVALDVGFDDRLYLLRQCSLADYVLVLDDFGAVQDSIMLGERTGYLDIAQREDGRLYFPFQPAPTDFDAEPGIDIYAGDGTYLGQITDPMLARPIRNDVSDDGTLYVLQEPPPPPPSSGGGGGPRIPPGPAMDPSDGGLPTVQRGPLARASGSLSSPASSGADDLDQDSPDDPGVFIFDPEGVFQVFHYFNFGVDVAVGPAGPFVSRYGAVHGVGEDEAMNPIIGQHWNGRPLLDVPRDAAAAGGVHAGLDHCSFQGVLQYPLASERPDAPWWVKGELDQPELEGPAFATRVDGGSRGAVLQQPFTFIGFRPDLLRYWDTPENLVFTQSMQWWGLDGSLPQQMGHCGYAFVRGTWAVDVAFDGTLAEQESEGLYLADTACVYQRPDHDFVGWSYCPSGLWGTDVSTHVKRIAADAGRVAVLDDGASAVLVLDAAGQLIHSWQIAAAEVSDVYEDIAIRGDRIYLAAAGSDQVEVRDLDGNLLERFPTAIDVLSLEVSPEGDVFIVGRKGWAARHAPDRSTRAIWRLPDPDAEARDITLDERGRVLIPWSLRTPGSLDSPGLVDGSGIWVFEERPTSEPPPPPRACQPTRDKFAAPSRVRLGADVGVTLVVDGTCPGAQVPVQIAIAFDTSRSMGWNYAMDKGKEAVLSMLAALDPAFAEVALVNFDDIDNTQVVEALTSDLSSVAREVAALRPRGDTRMGQGIEQARRQLTGPFRNPDARQILLIVTDGVPKDVFQPPLTQAIADGLEIALMQFDNQEEFQVPELAFMIEAAGGAVFLDPEPIIAERWASEQLTRYQDQDGLFETIEIRDWIPANMTYVTGSARPPATFDAADNSLTWTLGPVSSAEGIRLSYRLIPQEVGVWPTNVEARGDYEDAVGASGRIVFPIPEVEVYAPPEELLPIYLPFLIKQRCIRKARPLDVVLVLDASVSMSEPAPSGGTKLDVAVAAAGRFIDFLAMPQDHAAVVGFNATGFTAAELTGDRDALEAGLASLASSPGTLIHLGLIEAEGVLSRGQRPEALPVVILLTDGLHNREVAEVEVAAESLKQLGTVVYTIGLGADVQEGLLRAVASTPERYFNSPTVEDLEAIYSAIQSEIECEVEG